MRVKIYVSAQLSQQAVRCAGKVHKKFTLLAHPESKLAAALIEGNRFSYLYKQTSHKQSTGSSQVWPQHHCCACLHLKEALLPCNISVPDIGCCPKLAGQCSIWQESYQVVQVNSADASGVPMLPCCQALQQNEHSLWVLQIIDMGLEEQSAVLGAALQWIHGQDRLLILTSSQLLVYSVTTAS